MFHFFFVGVGVAEVCCEAHCDFSFCAHLYKLLWGFSHQMSLHNVNDILYMNDFYMSIIYVCLSLHIALCLDGMSTTQMVLWSFLNVLFRFLDLNNLNEIYFLNESLVIEVVYPSTHTHAWSLSISLSLSLSLSHTHTWTSWTEFGETRIYFNSCTLDQMHIFWIKRSGTVYSSL